jgi:glycosyltransferase involved in cell wall biosynthesis
MSPTKIAVLTPVRQGSLYLADALTSVQAQGFGEFSHIVVDGASSDGTVELLDRFDGRHLRWISEPDLGQSDALNKALALTDADWVMWLNSDEFYLAGAFSTVANAIREHPSADVLYGDFIMVDAAGRFRRLVSQHSMNRLVLRYYGPFVPSCSLVVRREILERAPWDVALRFVMDWDLYLGLLDRGAAFQHIPKPLGAFRIHDAQVTAEALAPDHPERRRIWERYGIRGYDDPVGRGLQRAARTMHRVKKVLGGGALRELRCLTHVGRDMRWFGTDGFPGERLPEGSTRRVLRGKSIS